MVEKATLARPYAKAAFESAREHHDFERWSNVLAIAAAVVADERVRRLLTNPRVAPRELVALVADAAGEMLDQRSRNFMATLAENRRLGLLPEISALFAALRAEAENIAEVRVTSAAPLDNEQRERLTQALRKRFQREVRLHCEVDASLVGGAVVRSGDFVIDGSLKARIERLAGVIAN